MISNNHFKNKYLKYKKKYLNFLNKHKGGMEPSDNEDIPEELLARIRLNYRNASLDNAPSSNIEEDIEPLDENQIIIEKTNPQIVNNMLAKFFSITDNLHNHFKEDIFNFKYLFKEFNIFNIIDDLINEQLNIFNNLLDKNNAIIAGGSIVNSIHSETPRDLDIYINRKNVKEFVKGLCLLGYKLNYQHTAPAYDSSFLRKNNIIYRLYFTKCEKYDLINIIELHFEEQLYEVEVYNQWNIFKDNKIIDIISLYNKPIDLMIIPDDIDPKNVANNFDLTFCQVYWNGKIIEGFTKEAVLKFGELNPEYHNSYVNGNWFLKNRASKYLKKGFKINLNISENIVIEKKKKNIIIDKWLIERIYKGILILLSYNYGLIYNFHNKNFELDYEQSFTPDINTELGIFITFIDKFGFVRNKNDLDNLITKMEEANILNLKNFKKTILDSFFFNSNELSSWDNLNLNIDTLLENFNINDISEYEGDLIGLDEKKFFYIIMIYISDPFFISIASYTEHFDKKNSKMPHYNSLISDFLDIDFSIFTFSIHSSEIFCNLNNNYYNDKFIIFNRITEANFTNKDKWDTYPRPGDLLEYYHNIFNNLINPEEFISTPIDEYGPMRRTYQEVREGQNDIFDELEMSNKTYIEKFIIPLITNKINLNFHEKIRQISSTIKNIKSLVFKKSKYDKITSEDIPDLEVIEADELFLDEEDQDCETLMDNDVVDNEEDLDEEIKKVLLKQKEFIEEINKIRKEIAEPLKIVEDYKKRFQTEIFMFEDDLRPEENGLEEGANYEDAVLMKDYPDFREANNKVKASTPLIIAAENKLKDFRLNNKEALDKYREYRENKKLYIRKFIEEKDSNFYFIIPAPPPPLIPNPNYLDADGNPVENEPEMIPDPNYEYLEDDYLCYDRITIIERLLNFDQWLIECIGNFNAPLNEDGEPDLKKAPKLGYDRKYRTIEDFNLDKFYIGIPIDKDGTLGYIEAKELLKLLLLLNENKKRFYLVPDTNETGAQKIITHTLSLKNLPGQPNQNIISANHCQGGSSILLYKIKICSGELCKE